MTVPPALPPAHISGSDSPGSSPFDALMRVDEHGEHWMGRDLQAPSGYTRWHNFHAAIKRAMASARNAGVPDGQFVQVSQRTGAGNLGDQQRVDYRLTRYAAYLVVMNGDPEKPEISAAQRYFAEKTREAEVRKSPAALTPRDYARLILEEADRADAAERKVAEIAPAAESWERLVDAAGDRSVREAAQILSRDPRVEEIGQKTLFALLRTLGWLDRHSTPYQSQINNGRLALRIRPFQDRDTGEDRQSYQVRVTAKGMHALHGHLTGAKPLQLRLAVVEDGGVA